MLKESWIERACGGGRVESDRERKITTKRPRAEPRYTPGYCIEKIVEQDSETTAARRTKGACSNMSPTFHRATVCALLCATDMSIKSGNMTIVSRTYMSITVLTNNLTVMSNRRLAFDKI